MMGDDVPDCELNHAPQKGMHFGYPYWHAGDVKDPEFGSKGKEKSAYTAPKAKLGAHTAPLGMRFYTGNQFPAAYKNNIILAKHGSWNRSKKSGYNLTRVILDANQNVVKQEVFAEGWLDDASQDVWGRPVDVLQMPSKRIKCCLDFGIIHLGKLNRWLCAKAHGPVFLIVTSNLLTLRLAVPV
jgi:glucose/arabinose dehydrogenase